MAEQAISIHGPYEDAIIKALEVVEKIVDKQPPEVAAELWKRTLEVTAPWHASSVTLSKQIADGIAGLLAKVEVKT